MRKEIDRSQLVTITDDVNGDPQIVNISSLQVGRVKTFLRSISREMGYQESYYDRHIKTDLNIIPYFRGFELNRHDPEVFLEKFFIVGQKGNIFLENVFESGIPNYFSEEITDKEVDELVVGVNNILRKKKRSLIDQVKFTEMTHTFSLRMKYMILLNFLHNIGGAWQNKKRSPFISASHGNNAYENALCFAIGREERDCGYILWGFENKNKKQNYLLTQSITEFIRGAGVDWYDDIHSEIIIKDGIFANKLLGVFIVDFQNNQKQFVINPSLYELFESDKSVNKIIEFICRNGIPVNQSDFDEFAAGLGYVSYGIEDQDGQRQAGKIKKDAQLMIPATEVILDFFE